MFLFSVGCSVIPHEAPNEDIDKAAALFFQRLGNEEYDTIYNDTSNLFKQNKTRQTIIDNLKQLAANGKVLDFQRLSMTFEGQGKDRMAQPTYRVTSDQTRGEMMLTFQDQGGEWKLFGFAYKPR
jgi:hypothetical protein